MKWFTMLCLSLVSFSVLAGEAATLKLIGFSGAGNYLAYQQHWIADGEDAAYVELHIIDVENNRRVTSPIKHHNPDSRQLRTTVRKNLKAANAQLKKYKIEIGNFGEHLVSQRPNNISANPKNVGFVVGTALANMRNIKYKLDLQEKETSINCGDAGNAKMFSLTLDGAGKVKTLHKDSNVPEERGCPLRYRIQDVYTYHEEFIAVFLNVYEMGFEGNSMRYMVVTGTLN